MDIEEDIDTPKTDLRAKVELLTNETTALRAEVKQLKEQNDFIINLLKEQNEQLGVKTKYDYSKLVKAEPTRKAATPPPAKAKPSRPIAVDLDQATLQRYIPIKTQEDLDEFEMIVDDTNIASFAKIVRNLLVDGTYKKSITKIFSDTLIMSYNVDGRHNKKRLLDYTKTLDVLHHALGKDDHTFKEFLDAVRTGFQWGKSRHFRMAWARRKKDCGGASPSYSNMPKVEEVYLPFNETEYP